MKIITIEVPDDFPEEIAQEAARAWRMNRPDRRALKERRLRELLDEARALDLDDVEEIVLTARKKRKARLGRPRAEAK